MRKKKKLTALTFAVIFVLLSLTACGGSAKKSFATAETAASAMDAGAMKREEAVMETGAGAPSSGGGLSQTSSSMYQTDLSRKLIRTVDLEVETKDFDELLTCISDDVSRVAGYIERSESSGSSLRYGQSEKYAYMTIRIPADKLDSFIATVETNSNITRKTENTVDVTLTYADIESHKKTLQIEQERLWELLAKAETTESIIALEQRLSEIRYQLESYESQLRLYDNQIAYSTVNISIYEVTDLTQTAPATPGQRIQTGFIRNLKSIGNFFVNTGVSLLSYSPVLAVFAILLLVIIKLIRRFRKKRIEKLSRLIENPAEENDNTKS